MIFAEAATGGGLKKGFLKNFVKFTGKQLSWSLFVNKVACKDCNSIKKETSTQAKFLRAPFLQNTPGQLFLHLLFSTNLRIFLPKLI